MGGTLCRYVVFYGLSCLLQLVYILLSIAQLFRPEELELLVRGSAEPLDIEQLRVVTAYEKFKETEPTIQYVVTRRFCALVPLDTLIDAFFLFGFIRNFWSIFKAMDPKMQRQLLSFVTGSDRIPATGTANLSFRITYAGEDSER